MRGTGRDIIKKLCFINFINLNLGFFSIFLKLSVQTLDKIKKSYYNIGGRIKSIFTNKIALKPRKSECI